MHVSFSSVTPLTLEVVPHLKRTASAWISHDIIWPLQVISQSWVSEGAAEGLGTTFFLDGAHTPESMATCAEWFAEASQLQQESSRPAGQPPMPPHRILLFNCMKVAMQADLINLLVSTLACCITPGLLLQPRQPLKFPAYCRVEGDSFLPVRHAS